MSVGQAQPKAVIKARVYRANKQKPKFVPQTFWDYAHRRKWRIAGRWENLGEIASTDMGNAHIITS